MTAQCHHFLLTRSVSVDTAMPFLQVQVLDHILATSDAPIIRLAHHRDDLTVLVSSAITAGFKASKLRRDLDVHMYTAFLDRQLTRQ